MNEQTMLDALKVDLGISTNAYDTRLGQYIVTARAAIEREGITLTNTGTEEAPALSVEDAGLVVMYAAWLWRKRDTGEGIPRMLRWQLNNRLFSKKAKAVSGNA